MALPADRAALAVLGREWLLHGHLQDRLGMALVMERAPREEMQEVAIEEWMAASPIYSRRMQQAMNFPGDGVDTILKNLQLDIGAPHEFMDFRYRLDDREHGEFWLAHCGALMDVEPMGEAFVHGMCHAIEDPTFDATAGATNPLAQVRPLHRPPRAPADRTPHCHWRVDIVAGDQQVEPHPNQAIVEASRLGNVAVPSVTSGETDGLSDYSGDFNPDFCLDDLSVAALHVVLPEFALQSHLLLRSLLLSATQRYGEDFAAAMVPRLLSGWGGLTAQRLRDALGLTPDADGLATMLTLHPVFNPATYVATNVVVDGDEVRLSFGDCPAAHEADQLTWFRQLGGAMDASIESIAQAFHPQARVEPTAASGDELFAYRAVIDIEATPIKEPGELVIAKISSGSRFGFRRPTARLLPVVDGLV